MHVWQNAMFEGIRLLDDEQNFIVDEIWDDDA